MNTSAVLAIDLALTIVGAGSWFAAASFVTTRVTRSRARRALFFIALGVLTLCGQLATAGALAGSGWWFAQEKVVFAVPLLLLATIFAGFCAVVPLLRVARAAQSAQGTQPAQITQGADATAVSAWVPTALIAAGCASVAGVLARTVVGYPLQAASGIVLGLLVLLATALSYGVLTQRGRRATVGIAGLAALVVVASAAWAWMGSMVSPDYAGTMPSSHAAGGHAAVGAALATAPLATAEGAPSTTPNSTVSVDSLRTPTTVPGPRKRFTLTAATESVTLTSGETIDTWNYGSLPGPELRVQQGDVVETHLENVDITAGVTIHWHGYDVPNGEDGVAGVTQDSVLPGESFDYRFVADQPGTYWYHTHQNASRGVQRGLYGTLIVEPSGGIPEQNDIVVPVHTIGGSVLLGDTDTAGEQTIPEGQTVRLRLVNTDMLPHSFQLRGADFRVVAADGRELNEPGTVRDKSVRLAAGARADLSFTMPPEGAVLTTDATRNAWITFSTVTGNEVSPPSTQTATPDFALGPELDLLGYGEGPATQLPDGRLVKASMVLDRNPRFMAGVPNYGYTVNGAVYPQIPSIDVDPGDVVELTVANRGWETHPMHVHGHHVMVLSRNGVVASGATLRLDTFDVRPGEVWVVAIQANNPGIWMDHCHNLDHAAEGMMMALHYRGVSTPFEHGGSHGNRSE